MTAEFTEAVRGAEAPALYVNYFEVGHNRQEFLVELGQYRHDVDGVVIYTRIATHPTYAKLLAVLLDRAVREHESAHGPIGGLEVESHPFDVVYRSIPEFAQRDERVRTPSRPQPR